jgi:hypothetical protein
VPAKIEVRDTANANRWVIPEGEIQPLAAGPYSYRNAAGSTVAMPERLGLAFRFVPAANEGASTKALPCGLEFCKKPPRVHLRILGCGRRSAKRRIQDSLSKEGKIVTIPQISAPHWTLCPLERIAEQIRPRKKQRLLIQQVDELREIEVAPDYGVSERALVSERTPSSPYGGLDKTVSAAPAQVRGGTVAQVSVMRCVETTEWGVTPRAVVVAVAAEAPKSEGQPTCHGWQHESECRAGRVEVRRGGRRSEE